VWWPALRAENRTIAEILDDAGLATGAILNYSYFEPVRGMQQGFDHYDNDNARLHQGKDPASTSGSSAREQSDKAIAWLETVKDRRFFLWVHYYDPHFRYEKHAGTPEFGDAPVDLYDHEILYTDGHIGRLLAYLRARGVWDKTVIIVTGDHGEGFGEHGIDLHGYHVYGAQTRVPLIVRLPGLAPRRVDMPAGHVDLLPTLANLVGAPATSAMAGRSLLGEPIGDRVIFQEVVFEGPTRRYAAVTSRWHLLFNMTPDNTWELYDLASDPAETRDVWGSHAGDVAALRARLLEWIDALQVPPDAAEKLAAALLAERPLPQVEARADFGGKVRLLGYDLPRGEVRRGESLDITYFFESLGRLDGDWRLFVHFEGPTRFQDDHVPVDGAYPFARWQKGQFIADARHVVVPAHIRPGDYTIHVGLWQPRKGNLEMTGAGERDAGNHRVRLGVVRVLP
jgi:arylsulfatase A-like enzyme